MTEPAGPMPEPLVNILTRRRIAIGRDSRGRVVVARPDSVLVRVGDSAERRDNIASWVANEALDGVTGIRDTLSADGHHVELNHVALGVPSVATLLGAPAMQVGDVVFTGQAMKNAAGEAVLRTSAEPAIAPRFLRGPLRMAGRRAAAGAHDGQRASHRGRCREHAGASRAHVVLRPRTMAPPTRGA